MKKKKEKALPPAREGFKEDAHTKDGGKPSADAQRASGRKSSERVTGETRNISETTSKEVQMLSESVTKGAQEGAEDTVRRGQDPSAQPGEASFTGSDSPFEPDHFPEAADYPEPEEASFTGSDSPFESDHFQEAADYPEPGEALFTEANASFGSDYFSEAVDYPEPDEASFTGSDPPFESDHFQEAADYPEPEEASFTGSDSPFEPDISPEPVDYPEQEPADYPEQEPADYPEPEEALFRGSDTPFELDDSPEADDYAEQERAFFTGEDFAAEKASGDAEAGEPSPEEPLLKEEGAAGESSEPHTEDVPSAEGAAKGEKELENTLEEVLKAPAKRSRKNRKEREAAYREKIRRHKRMVYLRTVLSVALFMGILIAALFFWMSRGYTRAELRRVCALPALDGTVYENLGGNVVQFGAAGAVCVDQRGNTLWNVTYEMQQPVVSVGKNVIAIANRSGNNVYVMNTKGLMGTIRTMLPIHSIAVGENGNVAVIMNDAKSTWIRLYTAQGNEIAYIVQTMEENGYPVAAAVSPDGNSLCISSVQPSNASVKSNVSFYNFGKTGKEGDAFRDDRYDYVDEVIPQLWYIDNSTCVGVSDRKLIYYRRDFFGKSQDESTLHKSALQGVFHSGGFTGLLFNNASEKSQYCLKLYNKRGKEAGSVFFSMSYTDIAIAGDKVYINNSRQCQIYTLGGRRLYDGTLGKTIRALVPGTALGDLLTVVEGEVDSVRLH